VLYQKIMKPYLFRKDPEDAHHQTIGLMRRMGKGAVSRGLLRTMFSVPQLPELHQQLWDLDFISPVGLAAGLDKNGEATEGFSSIGFGFIEIGTLTPRPQDGNERPRLFRLLPDQALINRMGFNNCGVEEAARHLSKVSYRPIPIGINIGKNKVTPNEEAVTDYRKCIKQLYPYADYFVVNISSPNTPGLRNLQHGEELKALLYGVNEEMAQQSQLTNLPQKPILIKLAPDVTPEELEGMIRSIQSAHISGIIATNTTLDREGLQDRHKQETGGLSGRPLTQRATQCIRHIYQLTEGKLPIIGVGGIFNGQDAYDKICAGASLVQVYTGFIYQGPELLKQIQQELTQLLKQDGYQHLSEAIGSKA